MIIHCRFITTSDQFFTLSQCILRCHLIHSYYKNIYYSKSKVFSRGSLCLVRKEINRLSSQVELLDGVSCFSGNTQVEVKCTKLDINIASVYAEALRACSPIQVNIPSCHWCGILTSNSIMRNIHRRQLCRGRAIKYCVEERTKRSQQVIIALFVWANSPIISLLQQ